MKFHIEVDTGAAASILNYEDYKRYFRYLAFLPVERSFCCINGHTADIAGQIMVDVERNGKRTTLSLLVTHCSEDHCSEPTAPKIFIHRAPMAQLVEHWAVMREVVSLTPAGPTLRVLKNNGVVSAAFVIAPANSLTFKSSRIRTISWRPRLTTLVANNCGTLKNPHTVRKELGTEFPVLWSGLYPSQKHLAGLAVHRDHS